MWNLALAQDEHEPKNRCVEDVVQVDHAHLHCFPRNCRSNFLAQGLVLVLQLVPHLVHFVGVAPTVIWLHIETSYCGEELFWEQTLDPNLAFDDLVQLPALGRLVALVVVDSCHSRDLTLLGEFSIYCLLL